MKKVILSVLSFALAVNSFAFIPEPSVKGAALGSAYTAGNPNDIFAASYNPASAINEQMLLGGAWHKRESAEQIYSVGFGYNFFNGITLNAFGNYLYDNDADFKNKEIKLGANFALHHLTEISLPITLGFTLKNGWLDVPGKDEHAFVGDLGLIVSPMEKLYIGAVYQNIGGKKGVYADDTYSIGAAYFWEYDNNNSFEFRFDAGKEDDHSKWGIGAEYLIFQKYAVRLGYIDAHGTDNFTFGGGVNFNECGRLDIAYLPYDYNKTYKLSYMIPFGSSAGGNNYSSKKTSNSKINYDGYNNSYSPKQAGVSSNQMPKSYETSQKRIAGQRQPFEVAHPPVEQATIKKTTASSNNVKTTASGYPNSRPKRFDK
ncbi:hypothetical protein Emin_0680 [Elusimicrobium minutum Pei191]|uniref:Uncharacterized protein n=1 Tax=Elusimicrobium minutum (strain Pei191) TaxID=445932 RepID=B2KCA8_ELUMP|nr:hypothetical protein [Elusimicrobium minutum]ACC98235.1 hypothetical protein Emin_0680 [Elusimicrobium minutum Pei191]